MNNKNKLFFEKKILINSIIIYMFGNLLDLIMTYYVYINKAGIEMNYLYNTIFSQNMTIFLIFKFFFGTIFIIILYYISKKFLKFDINFYLVSGLLLLMGIGFIFLGILNFNLL